MASPLRLTHGMNNAMPTKITTEDTKSPLKANGFQDKQSFTYTFSGGLTMKQFLAISLSVALFCAPLTVQAAEYRNVQPGHSYYLDQWFENQLVTVVGKENGKILIQYKDGAVDWIAPSHLMTRSESRENDGTEIAVATVIGIVALLCAFDAEACKNP